MDNTDFPSLQIDHPLIFCRRLVTHEPISKRVRLDSVRVRSDEETETNNFAIENIMEVEENAEQRDSVETLSPLGQDNMTSDDIPRTILDSCCHEF